MDSELLKQAIDEAYASASHDKTPLDAIEITHQAFPEPVRLVRWPLLGPEPKIFKLKHEDDAPLNPGQIVDYLGFPFEISIPDSNAEAEGAFDLRIAAYPEFDVLLMEAALTRGLIKMNYREYVLGMEAEGPADYWRDIEIRSPKREGGDITAEGVILGWMGKTFGELYRPVKYPGLVTGQ